MKLYVGNLPYQVAESDLQDWFSQAGVTVDSVSLVRDRFSGEPRGFGFVEIQNNEAAESAIRACNGKQLQGRAVVVNEARPQPPRGGGGGGGFGGGGGGRPSRGGGGGGRGGGSKRPPRW
jgi:RNA recognition motif-containing protein